jgi:hypothetical protein
MKKILSSIIALLFVSSLFSQKVGIGTTTPDPSAALDVTSTTQGMLVPRMTTAQRIAISNAANGLLVFDVTTNSFWFKGNSSWVQLVDSVHTEVHRVAGNKLYLGLTDQIGVGTMNPNHKLEVKTDPNQYGISHTDGNVTLATWTGDGGEIGTISNHPFRLYANDGYNQFVLLPSGNVGVNVFLPANKLDVSSSPRSGNHATNRPLYVTGDFLSNQGVEFRHSNGTQGIGFGFNTIYASGSNVDQDLGIASKGTGGSLLFTTNNTTRMNISGPGNVGIGVTSPTTTLDIARGTAPAGGFRARGTEFISTFYSGDNENIYLRGGKTGADIFLNDAEDLGNVLVGTQLGIGTYLPNQTLSVANKFGVDANGSVHFNNTPRQMYFFEDGMPSKMILSHSPSLPTWGLQYTAANKFRFLKDSTQVMAVDLGNNAVEVNGTLKIGHHIVESALVTVSPGNGASQTCNCPAGEVVLSGGYWTNYANGF